MKTNNPTQQQAVTTADKVFEQIQHAIVEGEIPSGSKISEPGLAKHYQISRSTLREALNRLEKCHLIERKANVGSRVVDCSIEGLLELYITREALEGMACRQAALNMSDEEIADMQTMLNVHSQTQELKDGVAYYQEEGDLDFHYKVILGSHNKQRFVPGLATSFLEHLGSIIAICIENAITQEQFKLLSLVDLLTRTKNRRYFIQSLTKEIARTSTW